MDTTEKSTVRIFVGSPGDVEAEQDAAFEVIERLDADYWKPKGAWA